MAARVRVRRMRAPTRPPPEPRDDGCASWMPRVTRRARSRPGGQAGCHAIIAPGPSAIRRVDRRFWVLATVIVVLILAAAAFFQLRRDDIGIVDAIYEAFASILGNADPSSLTTQDLKFFAIGLAIVGAIVLAAFYGLVVDVLMKTRVSSILGPHVGDAHDHVIVVGFGSLGYRVATALRERGIRVVAADSAPGRPVRRRAHASGASRSWPPMPTARTCSGRCASGRPGHCWPRPTTTPRTWPPRSGHAPCGPDLRITVRLFDPDLAARLETAFGGFESRSIHALAAPAFAAAAVGRQVLATIPVGTSRVLVAARVPIEEEPRPMARRWPWRRARHPRWSSAAVGSWPSSTVMWCAGSPSPGSG